MKLKYLIKKYVLIDLIKALIETIKTIFDFNDGWTN